MSDIDYDKYLRAGKGFPVIHTMISRIEAIPVTIITSQYPAPDNYHSICESLGDFTDALTYKSITTAPSVSFTDLHPWYGQGKFNIPQYKAYSNNEKQGRYYHPECYVLKLGDRFVSILIESYLSEHPIFAHEYLFKKDDDGFYVPTRREDNITNAADIGAGMLALKDNYDLIVDLPF